MEDNARYRYVKCAVLPEDALRSRQEEIEWREDKIRRLAGELEAIRAEPLQTEAEYSETVLPGEPGYDELTDHFDPMRYTGDWAWKGSQ